jgi:hypothetical protein
LLDADAGLDRNAHLAARQGRSAYDRRISGDQQFQRRQFQRRQFQRRQFQQRHGRRLHRRRPLM